MNLMISVLIVGLVIFPLLNASGDTGGSTSGASLKPEDPKSVNPEEDDLDINDIISIFGQGNEDYPEIKRSSSDLIDMDVAASDKETYHWKTVKPSGPNKKVAASSGNKGIITSGGKVYTLHIVTNDDSENIFKNAHNSNHQSSGKGGNHHLVKGRTRPKNAQIAHIVPRTNQKSDRGKTKIVKRFKPQKNEDPIKYDSQTHSEEVQEIILPAESEIVEDHKYEGNHYDIIHGADLKDNDIRLGEPIQMQDQGYQMDVLQEKVKIKHHHHHHHHNHVKTVVKKVPQPYPVEKVVHVPVEKIVHVPKPYPVDKFVEKVVHVPVERVIQVPKPVPVDRIVEKIVHVPRPYPVERIVDRPIPVEKEVKVPVRVNVPYPVERIVHVPKPYPVEKIVEKVIHVPKPYPVIKHIHVPVPVEVKVPIPVNKPYPVKVEVEKQVPVPVKVPYEVERKVPYPVKVEVEKKVPYPVKVYIPKPYPVEKKVPVIVNDNSNYRNQHKYKQNVKNHAPGFQSHFVVNHNQQQQDSTGYGAEQNYAYNDYHQQQSQNQQMQMFPYQYEPTGQAQQSTEVQYGLEMTANQQPTGQGSDQQPYVYDHEGQASIRPVSASSTDSQDAASEIHSQGVTGPSFQINVPEQIKDPMQFGESKTVSHLLQITPMNEKPVPISRPVDQFVVFHTGAGFSVHK